MSDFGPTEPRQFAPPPLPDQDQHGPGPELSGKAVASVIFGFFGLFTWALGAVPALILSLVALSDIRSRPNRFSGRGIAVVGLLLGITGLVIMPIIFISMLAASFGGIETPMAKGDRLIHIHLSGPVAEDPMTAVSFFGGSIDTLSGLIQRLEDGLEDEDVQGVILTLQAPSLGMAQAEELRTVLMTYRDAGKPVYVHATDLTTGSYALLAASSHINIVPTDTIWLIGLQMQSMYLAEGMEKIGIKADMLQAGEFKSANEMFSRNEPSIAASENMNWLLDGFYGTLVEWIAEGRGTSESEVRRLIDEGPYESARALEQGLVDSVSFLDEFLTEVRGNHGDDITIDNYYGYETPPSPWGASAKSKKSSGPQVALMYASGAIMRGHGGSSGFGGANLILSGDMIRMLDWIASDDNIKALVLRVDSPGGSAVASEEILRGILRVQEKKPVVISMGNTAASGGYYIACKADAIFADAMTLTASIGVISGKMVTTGMWDELGIQWHSWKRGENADILGSQEPFTPEQREWLDRYMAETYDTFTGHVVEGRKGKLTKPIEEIASGRVFTGAQALELGLVDEIGGLDDAIVHAAELAELDDYAVKVLPEPVTFWEALTSAMQGGGGQWSDLSFPDARSVKSAPKQSRQLFTGDKSRAPMLIEILSQLEPAEALATIDAINAAELMKKERVLALMPQRIIVR